MGKLTRYFFNGLAFLVPVVATIYVVYIIFVKVDSLFEFRVPGMGVLVTAVFITLIGFLASNFLTRWLVGLIDGAMSRLPLVKMIYTSLKDLINAFVGGKRFLNRPVAVQLDREVKLFGFVTCEDLGKFGMKESVSVYLPQSYNFAGNMIVVPREKVTPVSADSGEFMTFIVSGGVATKSRG
jgi:uncharacterized membrane protein